MFKMDIRKFSFSDIAAALQLNPSMVKSLVSIDSAEREEGNSLSDEVSRGVTMLWQASALGDVTLAALLLSFSDVDINFARACDGVTCLYIASQNGHLPVVSFLLRNGADVDKPRLSMATPLFIATQNNHIDVVHVLLSHGADVHKENNQLSSTIFQCVKPETPKS